MIESISNFIQLHFWSILAIIAAAFILNRISGMVVSRVVHGAVRAQKHTITKEEQKRAKTLIGIITTVVHIGIWIIALLMILDLSGVNTAPLLAGAGVIGVALGFGAQSFVKDSVNGIFILLENQYRVGDVVKINDNISGVVEKISLRETVLRDIDGNVHHFSNGTIEIATNMTKDFANINLDIGVSYTADIEKVEKVINDVGLALKNDSDWRDKITEAPSFLRVNEFADSAVIIKITGKTQPMQQWAAAGELRKRLKIAFDKHGIEIPYQQVVVHSPKEK
jgi:moderate conductance mechanosensitive channel